MERETLRLAMKTVLEEELDQNVTALDDDVQLEEQLGLDSMDMVSLVMRVEQQFRIRLTHDELLQVATVGEMLDLILGKLDRAAQMAA